MINLGWLGQVAFTWEFLIALVSIVFIDLVLAGDNAVVIAMAVKKLQGKKRKLGIILGAAGAVFTRVTCTFVVAGLLNISYVKLIGGIIIIWIAIKLLIEGAEEEKIRPDTNNIWQAVWIIIVADMSMGIDNMLAVGAASHGNFFLLLFGLALSIPFVVFLSSLLTRLIDRFPIILWFGAALLGKVGGEMIITDPFIHNLLNPSPGIKYTVIIFSIVFVCAFSKWRLNKINKK